MVLSRDRSGAVKGAAILCVLLGHMGYISGAGAWGVNLFLFMSGFGLQASFLRGGVKDFWKKRVGKLFVPYVVFQILPIFVSIWHNTVSCEQVLFSFLGLDFGLNIDPSMWFISYVFVWYLVFWTIKKWVPYKAEVFVWILACMTMMLVGKQNIIWNNGAQVWQYAFSFAFGV